MNLTELQAKVVELVQNTALLAGVFVVADDGMINEDVENALVDHGFAVIVSPVLQVQKTAEASSTQLVQASFIVEIQENPEQNSSHAAIDPLGAAVAIINAVTAYRSGPGDQRFEVGSTPIELYPDPGNRVYLINFTKLVQLS